MQEKELNELKVIAEIREALGVGEKPMLSELPKIIRDLKVKHDRNEATLSAVSAGLRSLNAKVFP